MLTIEKEIEEVLKLRESDSKTFQEIADELGFSEKTARRRYKAGVVQRTIDVLEEGPESLLSDDAPPEIKVNGHYIPNGKRKIERFVPLRRTGDVMITADYHIPLHDPEFINVMINCARENDIKQLIIAGDFWNMDDFSSYLPHQPEASWQIERYDGNLIMKTFLQTFDKVDFIWGNHDFRVTKATGFKDSFTACMKWALNALTEEEMSKIRFSDLDYMFYDCEHTGREFRICHPSNYSKIPLTVPRGLAVKYNTGVMSAHSHHCSMGVAANGKDLIMELGGFFDKDRTEYIQRTNTSHEWVQGFVMFKDGVPSVISPAFKNHEAYLEEVKK